MKLNPLYSPDEQDLKLKYSIIVAKLHATIAKHKSLFPQLAEVESFLEKFQTEIKSDEDCLQKLEELCSHFKDLSVSSHAIRHLHYNLCADVAAVENKNFKINKDINYIILPN